MNIAQIISEAFESHETKQVKAYAANGYKVGRKVTNADGHTGKIVEMHPGSSGLRAYVKWDHNGQKTHHNPSDNYIYHDIKPS